MMNQKIKSIAVLGSGSWGSAFAIHLAKSGHSVRIWARGRNTVNEINQHHTNQNYLPDVVFPKSLTAYHDLASCCDDVSDIIVAVPSHAFESILLKLPSHIQSLSWLTKGIDPTHHTLLSSLVLAQYGKDFPAAIISGPSFALELAQGLPTAVVVASQNQAFSDRLQHIIHHQNLRAYTSQDLIGVQCAGAIKNVLAIACGISDGLAFGANAKAALITRGLNEMSKLGQMLGAQAQTFSGLAGLGDLVLTCTDNQSRNRRFGLLLGQGQSSIEAEHLIGQVVEGKHNASQVCALAEQHHIHLPICKEVHNVLQGKSSPHHSVDTLLSRPAFEEF